MVLVDYIRIFYISEYFLTDVHVTYVYGTVRYSFLYVNHDNTCTLKKM
jgi:hypothetical protein